MKIKKSHVGLLFTLVVGFFVVYFATGSVEVYVPVSQSEAKSDVIIILDPGHGGLDSGCLSETGFEEKHANLSIALSVRDMLTALGYQVEMTRDTDISIHDKDITGTRNQKNSDMDNRLALFNKYDNAVCVCIHQNKFTEPKYWGAQMFYSGSNPMNESFAGIMMNEFVTKLQPDNKRELKPTTTNIYLTHNTKNPSLMVECGFLSNPEEAALLETKEYQSKVAFTIFSGIDKFVSENIR